ncbi:hypothetical protein D3C75_850590 [compost metagenome]
MAGQEVVAFIGLIDNFGRLRLCIQQCGSTLREIFRNHDGHVVGVILQAGFSLRPGDKIPFETVGLLKLCHQVIPGCKLRALIVGAFIFIDYSDGQLIHFAVRIPECLQEQSAVQHRNEQDDKHWNQHLGILERCAQVLGKYG